MPKSYFSVSGTASIHDLNTGDRIHIIGVCGVAMAQIAVLLTEKGFIVSGSDKEFYEPMASLLAHSSVKTCTGYRAENIHPDTKLVVIGNVISYGHPEVEVVESKHIPYTLFTKLLYELIIQGRHSIVVSGTHGKSTTTALIASMLFKVGRDPGYFIGAVARDLPSSLRWGRGAVSVVEGDEYDSAFFAKVPKFFFYQPNTWIITSIEFDHADIYADLAAIEAVFTKKVHELSASDTVICCIDDANVARLLSEWRTSTSANFITYGESEAADYQLISSQPENGAQQITIKGRLGNSFSFLLPLAGKYNARNGIAAQLACRLQKLDNEAINRACATFSGVKRRQEIRFNSPQRVLIEDFAHHPTAVRETLQGIRSLYPTRRIWAVFEPRSNTSRRKVFQEEYMRAFAPANQAILCVVNARANDSADNLIDVDELTRSITTAGVPSLALPDAASIAEHILKESGDGDVVVLMSNGSFGGLPKILEDAFVARWGR